MRISDGVPIETVPVAVVPERVKARTAQVAATKEPRMKRGEVGIRHDIAAVTRTSSEKFETALVTHTTHTPGVTASGTPLLMPASEAGVRNGAWFLGIIGMVGLAGVLTALL